MHPTEKTAQACLQIETFNQHLAGLLPLQSY